MSKQVKTDHNFDKQEFAIVLTRNIGIDSHRDFSLRAGISHGLLSQYINNRRDTPPTPSTIFKISRATKKPEVAYRELLNAAGYEPPKYTIDNIPAKPNTIKEVELLDIIRNMQTKLTESEKEDFIPYLARTLDKYQKQIICLYRNK